jgi:hypothetical protein
MNSFNDREKLFENKFAHDQDLQFKVQARRNKLLGQWAAQQMGKDAAASAEYASAVVLSDFDEPGDDDVLRKVLADLENAGLNITRDGVRKEMDRLMIDAKKQIMEEQSI